MLASTLCDPQPAPCFSDFLKAWVPNNGRGCLLLPIVVVLGLCATIIIHPLWLRLIPLRLRLIPLGGRLRRKPRKNLLRLGFVHLLRGVILARTFVFFKGRAQFVHLLFVLAQHVTFLCRYALLVAHLGFEVIQYLFLEILIKFVQIVVTTCRTGNVFSFQIDVPFTAGGMKLVPAHSGQHHLADVIAMRSAAGLAIGPVWHLLATRLRLRLLLPWLWWSTGLLLLWGGDHLKEIVFIKFVDVGNVNHKPVVRARSWGTDPIMHLAVLLHLDIVAHSLRGFPRLL